jgi:hypothetical protein
MRTLKSLAVSLLLCLPGGLLHGQFTFPNQARHTLVISIDGMHELDFQLWVKNNPASAIAQLAAKGVHYSNAYATKPGDSIPATVGMFTGATAAIAGLYYDDAYNRVWFPATNTACTAPAGTVTSLKQDIDWDPTALDGGASAHNGQGINPALLPRQLAGGQCVPVYPHNQMRVNTVFEAIKTLHGHTAFSEKRPSYEFLQGPSGQGVDDLFLLEINANNALANVALTEAFDSDRVTAVLNWIDGKDHTGTKTTGVPNVYGMNFQALNSAKKVSTTSGYADSFGTPDSILEGALQFVDQQIGSFVAELAAKGLTKSTAIILMAKHGESPVDPAHRNIQPTSATAGVGQVLGSLGLSSISSGPLTATKYKITNKTAVLIWLGNQALTQTVATALINASNSPGNPLNIAQVLYGSSLQQLFPDPTVDAAVPDILVIPNLGTNYEPAGSTTFAEHGGFQENELHVPILIVHNTIKPGVIHAPVTTTQIAPTILSLLNIEPRILQGVQIEGAAVLPGLPLAGPIYFPWFALP